MTAAEILAPGPHHSAAVGMTLAAIAYSDTADRLKAQLAYPNYATKGQWTLVWLGESPGNQMYVAAHDDGVHWAIAIRGSVTDPLSPAFWDDWFLEDAWVETTVPWMFAGQSGARISRGSSDGLAELLAMQDTLDTVNSLTLVEFIRKHVELSTFGLVVVGHSLGGALASVLAPYLYETLHKPGVPTNFIVPTSFAAPTAGNREFANYLTQTFFGFPYRYVNDLDVAPHSWDVAGLTWIALSFNGGPKIPSKLFDGIIALQLWLVYWDLRYTQPGYVNVTNGTLSNAGDWYAEATYQHATSTYLGLYDAPVVTFPNPPGPFAATGTPVEALASEAP